jgi:hypothetical protein
VSQPPITYLVKGNENMNYTIRKPTVGDMRAIYNETDDQSQVSFLLAERCILLDNKPIGKEGLDKMDLDVFEGLIEQVYPGKKS